MRGQGVNIVSECQVLEFRRNVGKVTVPPDVCNASIPISTAVFVIPDNDDEELPPGLRFIDNAEGVCFGREEKEKLTALIKELAEQDKRLEKCSVSVSGSSASIMSGNRTILEIELRPEPGPYGNAKFHVKDGAKEHAYAALAFFNTLQAELRRSVPMRVEALALS